MTDRNQRRGTTTSCGELSTSGVINSATTTVPVQQATILPVCQATTVTTIGGQFTQVAEQAVRQKQSISAILEALLGAEVEERDRNAIARRIKESHFLR